MRWNWPYLALVFGLLLIAIEPCRAAEVEKRRPPNIIVVLIDDLGAKELGCYGNSEYQTPFMDEMARGGVQFQTAYACPVCHPTRFEILTGQYGCHNGVYNFPDRRGGPAVADEGPDNIANHRTIAQILKDAGYATAMSAKWQLSGRPPTLITEAGFDEYSCWAYRQYYTPDQSRLASQAGIVFRSRYWHPSVVQNGRWVPTTAEDYGPDIWNAFVRDFLTRNKEKPVFVYYPMCLTHSPWVATPDTATSEDDRTQNSKRHFRANVEYTDKLMGRLLQCIRDLGLEQDTILLITADNGTGGGEGKAQPTELGARVPFIAYGPGYIRPRPPTGELTDLSDVLPTVVEFAGGELPSDRPIDGVSLAPFLRGESETTRDWIFSYIADRRILRTKRYLLEDNSPLHPGRLYDCGDSRDGKGYREVTKSTEPEVEAVRQQFATLLEKLPAPILETEGPANETIAEKRESKETKREEKRENRRQNRRRNADG